MRHNWAMKNGDNVIIVGTGDGAHPKAKGTLCKVSCNVLC